MARILNLSSSDALTLGVSSVIGVGVLYNSYKLLKKIIDDQPPKKWRKVGEISDLWIFPVKSAGPILVKEFDCGLIGPRVGHIRDRVFTITHASSGECMSGSTYPKVVRVFPRIEGSLLTLTADGMKNLSIDIEPLYSSTNFVTVKYRLDDAQCVDCGDEAAKWLSKFILGKDEGLRLNFYASQGPKNIRPRNYPFEHAEQKDSGAFHDESSYLIMNQASFDDLNTRIEKKVGALQYRPNFLVKGPPAWDEDNWRWLKIGDTIFKNVQPCIRCVFTNVDPATGERHPQMEPLKTLKSYRTFEHLSTNPKFGVHLGVRGEGKVKLGDEVFVGA